MVFVNDLYFAREEILRLKGINVQLFPGELLQIEGPNGVGKTTLLKLLAGLIVPDKGEIHIPEKIAYLPDSPALTSWLTVEENVAWWKGIYQSNTEEKKLLEIFELKKYQHFLPQALSQGLKRRLGFIQLLMTQASVWLLDEPFNSLDNKTIQLMQSLMEEYLAKGNNIILTTHLMLEWPFSIKRFNLAEK